MLNYLRSELYRARKSKLVLAMLVIVIVFVTTISEVFSIEDVLGFMADAITIPYICAGLISFIIVNGEYKNKTIDNAIASGFTEIKIYFSKIIVSIIVGTIMLVVAFVIGLISANIVTGPGIVYKGMNNFIHSMVVCIPAFIASIMVANTAYFVMRKELYAIVIWYVYMFAIDTVVYMIRDVELRTIELMKKIFISAAIRGGFGNGESYSYPWEYNEGIMGIWTASSVAIIISLVCCFVRFKKKAR